MIWAKNDASCCDFACSCIFFATKWRALAAPKVKYVLPNLECPPSEAIHNYMSKKMQIALESRRFSCYKTTCPGSAAARMVIQPLWTCTNMGSSTLRMPTKHVEQHHTSNKFQSVPPQKKHLSYWDLVGLLHFSRLQNDALQQSQTHIRTYHVNLARPFSYEVTWNSMGNSTLRMHPSLPYPASYNIQNPPNKKSKYAFWFCMIFRFLGFSLLQGDRSSPQGHIYNHRKDRAVLFSC